MTKPLRQAMPYTTDIIDVCREVFGADSINPAIKAGMDGQPTFWAQENGRQIGTPIAYNPAKRISLAECQLGPFNPANAPQTGTKGKRA